MATRAGLAAVAAILPGAAAAQSRPSPVVSVPVRTAVAALREPDPCGDDLSLIPLTAADIAHAPQIRQPVLLLYGCRDPLLTPDAAQHQAQLLRSSSSVTTTIFANSSGDLTVIETSFGKLDVWDTPVSAGGPPVVFLQGLLAGPDVWFDVLGSLAPRRRCIAVDWPFGAHSSPMEPHADLSPPGQARLVVEVLDRLGLERAVLVGNDSGGVISQLVVASAPQRVCGLVLVACDAFEVFPPAAYRAFFALAGAPGFMALVGRMLSRPSFARSRLGYGPVIANHPEGVAHWADPLASDPLIRRDLVKLMRGASNTQTLAAAKHFPGYERPILVV